MPIGDLLAQISGDGPSPNPAPSLPRTNTLPKRKPDDDLRSSFSKQPRITTLSSTVAPRSVPVRPRPVETSAPPPKASLPSRPLDRPSTSQRPVNGSNSKPSVLSKPMNGGNRVSKPSLPSRPSPTTSTAPSAPRGAPKKGSFAEILARGQRAQAVMGQVGKIQHKKVEKGAPGAAVVKKDEPKIDSRTPNKKLPQKPSGAPGGYTGTSKPGQRNGTPVNGSSKDNRNGNSKPAPLTKAERAKIAAEEERAKRKKMAATATTGYTGTARPKPGASSKKRDTHRGGALLNTRAPRPSHSRSRFDDEYDEELDDFIDYDDEEDDEGPRYDYASDASSDMEAGLDDIDTEERRAEVIARREDIEEERLERSLKAAKEERKRRALDELRAGRRR